jgi:acyl-CoA dehydrogenase
MVSARFGDILSELYLSSAALKRWNDEGQQQDDLPLLTYCMEASFATIVTRFDEIIVNFPVRPVAWILRFLIQPFGPRRLGPSDRVTAECAATITNPCLARDRITVDLFKSTRTEGEHPDGVAVLERAFAMTVAVQPIRDRMHAAHLRDIDQAVKQRTITADEAAQLRAAANAASAAIAVDDFAPEELTSRGASNKGDVSSQVISQPRPAAAE